MNLSQVNTESTMPKDSLHYINSLVWRMTYATLQTGKITPKFDEGYSESLPPPIDSLNRRIERYRKANPTYNPIMLLRTSYSSIDSNAIRDNLFTIRNGQLYDVPNRSRSPYKHHTIFMAASDDIEDRDGEVTFILPEILAFHNEGFIYLGGVWGSVTIESEGNIQHFYKPKFGLDDIFDKPFTFRYTTTGMKEVKLTFSSGSSSMVMSFYIKIIHTNFGTPRPISPINQRYANSGADFIIPAVAPLTNGHAGCKLQTRLSLRNTATQPAGDIRFQKPLIVLEGYDAYAIMPWVIENKDINDFMGVEFGGANITTIEGYDLNDFLDRANYDIIYVDYGNGADDITRNGVLLQDVLRWVNARKVNNAAGVREQNVVMGMSMGGLVGRYGLADMEKKRRAGISNNEHETRLLITHDSPHRGANFPLALQSFIETGRAVLWAWELNPLFKQLADYANAPANKQMGIYQTVPIGALAGGNILYQKNTWLTDVYKPMVSFPSTAPAPYQEVAMSNGSECGARLFNPYSPLLTHQISGFLSPIPWLINAKWTTGLTLRALPDRQSRQIYNFGVSYSSSFFGGLITINRQVIGARGISEDYMLPLDGIAGGKISFALKSLGFGEDAINLSSPSWFPFAGFEIISTVKEEHSFIPKYSALDVNPDISDAELVASTLSAKQVAKTSFSAIFTVPQIIGSEFNQSHLLFNRQNARWMFSQMEPNNLNGGGTPILDCSNFLCNPNTIMIESTGNFCSGFTSNFSLSNLPSFALVAWSATNNLVTFSDRDTPTTVISASSPTESGFVTINANVTSPLCNPGTNVSRNFSKRIWIGEPQQINFTAGVQACNYVITANSAGATDFIWEVKDLLGNDVGFIRSSTNSIAIHASEWRSLNISSITVTCKASNNCVPTPRIRTKIFNRPTFPLCPLRVIQPTLTAFPNPTNSILNLKFDNLDTNITSICVMNSLGIKALCEENTQLSAEKQTTLNLSNLPEGIYVLQIVYENGFAESKKIVVQKGVIAN